MKINVIEKWRSKCITHYHVIINQHLLRHFFDHINLFHLISLVARPRSFKAGDTRIKTGNDGFKIGTQENDGNEDSRPGTHWERRERKFKTEDTPGTKGTKIQDRGHTGNEGNEDSRQG